MNLTTTKLAVFSLSAGMAGLAGALFGGLHLRVEASDFTMLGSLVVLLLVTIGGINSVSGAFVGGLLLSGQALLAKHVPHQLGQLTFLGTGLGAVGLAWLPSGITGRVGMLADRLRRPPAPGATGPPAGPGTRGDVSAPATTQFDVRQAVGA
jgi:branched-chain amino acid transport system permease protein